MRATHTVNQLLALARAGGSGAALSRLPCDWQTDHGGGAATRCPRAMEKHIDLGYEGAAARRCRRDAQRQPHLLKELVRNLVDNAINYTPSTPVRPGIITARAGRPFGQVLVLQVEDSAPASPSPSASWFSSLFTGCWAPTSTAPGLGLPIVIAQQEQ
jgi:two-component system sensor histidine kinase TctE